MSICQCVIASVCGHVRVCVSACSTLEVAKIGENKCVSAPTYDCDLAVRRFQPLMTFACCCCEQSDPAVLIKTNGTDHSPLIVFH